MSDIQEALNRAFAEAKGFYNIAQMLEAVPVENRLADDADRQAKINHAVAYHSGFDSVQDLINANGMQGRKREPVFKA